MWPYQMVVVVKYHRNLAWPLKVALCGGLSAAKFCFFGSLSNCVESKPLGLPVLQA
jgi:hypothetical protein